MQTTRVEWSLRCFTQVANTGESANKTLFPTEIPNGNLSRTWLNMAPGLNLFSSSGGGGGENKKKKEKEITFHEKLDTELWTCMTKTTKVQTGSHQGAGVTNICLSPEQFNAGWHRGKPLLCFSFSLHNLLTWHAVTESNPNSGHWQIPQFGKERRLKQAQKWSHSLFTSFVLSKSP